ncbi:MAG: molybdopterin-dependent oxidoreductase [Actinomycetota bacterium]|nr:molybdopterin-dependent oxidoreductase [Actinomycetota bacterium]
MSSSLPWPALRQLTTRDHSARRDAAKSRKTEELQPRTATADKVVPSICPFCAVGCGQQVFVKDDKVIQIEGDPDSPISRGRLCPKGSATLQLTTGDSREEHVLYRRPGGTDWERMDLDVAMDKVADKVIAARKDGWEWESDGKRTRRTMGVASLGGATLDNEENYLIKKLFTALGIVQVENQARICHSSTVAALGTSFGRGGSTTYLQDLQRSDCILIEGSNFAEAHPVGFQWVMEAKARGAKIIHVDPRFSRTSAMADVFVPLRAGTDIVWLGALINHVLTKERYFRDYVVNYTNAATILRDDFQDTEDLDGLFSGMDADSRVYDGKTWQYDGAEVAAASGERDKQYDDITNGGASVSEAGHSESHGSGGPTLRGSWRRDETLEDPNCVFQVLRRHYARYTPEMVQEICGVPPHLFHQVADLLTENSGRERTSAFAYAVGWTHHTVGVQYIRAAAVLQLLLGNIGRPGGGIMALRGHASIQGSSDIPTLFDLLPGYIPMPHAHLHENLTDFLQADAGQQGFWANMPAYMVSLLKAWWGDAATADNDFRFDYLPRLTGSHGTYETVQAQLAGTCKGYFLLGENPAVGSANAGMQRRGMANLDWLVVRDFSLIESATWWKDGPEIQTGELKTAEIDTEVFFFPAAAHTEKKGTFTNTNRLLQWHEQAIEPSGDRRSDLWFIHELGRLIRAKLAGSTDEMDAPVLDLTWDYPTEGKYNDPSAAAVLREINGCDADGNLLSGYTELKDDGSTRCGCWIYSGAYADGVNQTARRKPHTQQSISSLEWGWAWPANRRELYNRASADPDGKPWSERKKLIWWDSQQEKWVGDDVPDFEATKAPTYRPADGATGVEAIRGDDPFIMQSDGKGWLYVPTGLVDGPMPTHYEPQDSPFENALYTQQRNPVRQVVSHKGNRYHPSGKDKGADVFPYVATTYRLTEHFTAGGMTRWLPYLAELQPAFFCEVSPELAAERKLKHHDWATIVTARGAVEARVMVTRRMQPLKVQGRIVHQIGMPFHWGGNGLTTGDAMNELTSIALDPNVHIQETKALTVDIRPGRRPRGAALPQLVESYRQRAGITEHTGMEGVTPK